VHTACNSSKSSFQPLGSRRVEAAFNAGRVSSDAGVLLLRETAEALALFPLLEECFVDHRDPSRVEHSLKELLAQRIFALACGYEDLNDHDYLRDDPLFAVAVGKRDPFGQQRLRSRDKGTALASHSTLNRIELAPAQLDDHRRDLKILHNPEALEDLLVDLFLDAHREAPASIVLDVDATDNPLHGRQEGRFFHGYYDCYCYKPLYIFCGDDILAAKLQTADGDEARGALPELQRVVDHIRSRWPDVHILIRGDSAYCRDALMDWCESTDGVDFLVGIAKNTRLLRMIETELEDVRVLSEAAEEPVRQFVELRYRTLETWSRERRVVAKAEHIIGKANPRFVITSLSIEDVGAKALYEEMYCARGDMENRIKEQQLGLFADRSSAHTLRANQVRLWLSAFAYVLVATFRRAALHGTTMARAQAWTLRERLFKIGALVRVSARRVWVSMSSAFPHQELFTRALTQLRASYPDVF
jgi:hypothetical protein